MSSGAGGGKHARSGMGWVYGLLLPLIAVEVLIDILGLPLDGFLIPVEAVVDVGLLLVGAVSSWASGAATRSVGSGRPMRRSRRAVANVSFLGIAIYWGLVIGIIVFQVWWASQNVLLALLLGIFIFAFDALLILIGFLITVAAVIGRFRDSGRQIGGGGQ